MSTYFPTTAQAVLKNGYPICAIAPHGKGPRYRGWQEKSLTAEQCEESRFADNGIGILCGMEPVPVIGIDADIPDKALADAVFARWTKDVPALANATRRWGAAPKFLLMVRFEHSRTKEKFGCYVKEGRKAEVEILGKGQQFCALHIHPGTGKPYTWEDPEGEVFGFVGSGCHGDPSTRPLEALPLLTEADLTQLQRGYREECRKAGYSPFNEGAESSVAGDEPFDKEMIPRSLPVPGIDIGMAEKLLEECEFDLGHGSYDTWVKIGMALHHQFAGAPEALALWDQLSAQFPDAYTDGACEARWKGFKDDRPDTVTFRWVQKVAREKQGTLLHDFSEGGLYHRVLYKYGRYLAWDYENRRWLYFKNGTWLGENGQAFVQDAIRDVIENELPQEINSAITTEQKESLTKFYNRVIQKYSYYVKAVSYLLSGTGALSVSLREFDANPNYFGVDGGVIDLNTGGFLSGEPEMKVLRHSQIVPDPGAKCPVWEKAILDWLTPPETAGHSREECLQEGREKVAFMKRLLGASLRGKPEEQVFLLCVGNGNNGKSVFLNTLNRFFGKDGARAGYAETLNADTLMGSGKVSEGGRARADIAKLCGARFVFCSETENTNGVTLREADIKRMTGNDPMTARAPFAIKEVTFDPSWLLCLATNSAPTIRGDDEGIWRRVLEVDFLRKLDEDKYIKVDKKLGDKLNAEFPGILNWMLEGLWEYERLGGLQVPKSVIQQVKEYRRTMDSVGNWMDSCLKYTGANGNVWVTSQQLYASFNTFLTNAGEPASAHVTASVFLRRLNKRIGVTRRKRTCSGWKYLGYQLRDTDMEDDIGQGLTA